MRISTKVVIDIETGEVLHEEGYEYSGPVALCDRSAQADARQTFGQASRQSGTAAGLAGSVAPGLIGSLQAMANNPQGYGQSALNTMQNEAEAAAGSAADKQAENSRLQAMRSGNVAGLTAAQTAGTEGATRATQTSIQDILAQNAKLKAQQQEGALQGLGNVLSDENRTALGSLGEETDATNALTNAGKSGWFQNMIAGIDAFSPTASFKGVSIGKQ